MWCVGHVACVGEVCNPYKVTEGKREGLSQFNRPQIIWERKLKWKLIN